MGRNKKKIKKDFKPIGDGWDWIEKCIEKDRLSLPKRKIHKGFSG